jgi:hypothetical protein
MDATLDGLQGSLMLPPHGPWIARSSRAMTRGQVWPMRWASLGDDKRASLGDDNGQVWAMTGKRFGITPWKLSRLFPAASARWRLGLKKPAATRAIATGLTRLERQLIDHRGEAGSEAAVDHEIGAIDERGFV